VQPKGASREWESKEQQHQSMRIIGQIDHPTLKISVFKNDNRTFLKFENGASEITMKLGDDDRFKTVEAIQQIVDAPLLEAVNTQFRAIHLARLAAIARAYPAHDTSEFETII
jgi:hypothetical protein